MNSVEVVIGLGPRKWVAHRFALEGVITLSAFLKTHLEQLQQDLGAESDRWSCTVWGHKKAGSYQLLAGDRLEFTLALQVDPKVARRQRFKSQGARMAGLFERKTQN